MIRGYFLFLTGGKPSGKEVKRRQDTLDEKLKDIFEEKPGCTIQQVKAMSLLDDNISSTMLTRALKRVFPSVLKTKRTNEEKGYPFMIFYPL